MYYKMKHTDAFRHTQEGRVLVVQCRIQDLTLGGGVDFVNGGGGWG